MHTPTDVVKLVCVVDNINNKPHEYLIKYEYFIKIISSYFPQKSLDDKELFDTYLKLFKEDIWHSHKFLFLISTFVIRNVSYATKTNDKIHIYLNCKNGVDPEKVYKNVMSLGLKGLIVVRAGETVQSDSLKDDIVVNKVIITVS